MAVSVRKHLYGDITLPKGTPLKHRIAFNRLLRKTAAAARDCGQRWQVVDGYRPYADQVRLYRLYKAGRGNLAAYPGTSNHGRGKALDTYAPDGKPVGASERRRRACIKRGLAFPVPGEAWHIEEAK